MRAVRDTFLHFLADNLSGVKVRGMWRDPNYPDAQALEQDVVNVQFLDDALDPILSTQKVSIQIVASSEFDAISWSESLWKLLSGTFYTPLYDYSDPKNPKPLGSNISWAVNSVRFKPIRDDYYFRYLCILPLNYHV